ncbi:vacuolar protein sorting-associated protein 35, partial [Cunninghamella echinulata]
LSIQDIMELLVAITNLSLSCYPERLDYMDQILIYCKDKCVEYADSTDLHSKTTEEHLMTLLLAPIQQYDSILTLLMLQNYNTLFEQQSYNTRRRLALAIVTSMLSKGTLIETPEDVHTVLELCNVLLQKRNESTTFYYEEDVTDDQLYIAKIIHLFQSKENDKQFLLLSATRRQLGEDKDQIKYTFPSLITSALKLSHRYQKQVEQNEIWEKKTIALFRFIHQVISILYKQCEHMTGSCLQYFLMAGQSADVSGFEDLAYEFFVQGFNVYEESISDSKAQYQAIIFIIGSLYQTIGFSKENYTSLITRAALHGSKLLKKPDRCRAVYLASHLWRNKNKNENENGNENQIESQNEGENENEDGNRVDNLLQQQNEVENKRILECLQKGLKIADSCMDPVVNLELFVEILNQCIFYFQQNNDKITTKYINGLIDMIKSSLSNLDEADEYPFTSSSSTLLQQNSGLAMAKYVRRQFTCTLKYLKHYQELESDNEENKYKDIVL